MSTNLTKIDLLNAKLPSSFRGYCRSEVDRLLADAAEALGELAEERQQLSERAANLETSLAEHKQREQVLRDTLVTTQKMVEDLKANARKEAQLILEDAQSKAEAMLRRAHSRMAQIHEDITELKRQRTQFEVKLRSLLDAHQRMLEMEHQEEQELESLESKLTFLAKTK